MFAFRRGRLPILVPLALAVAFGYLLAGGLGSALGGGALCCSFRSSS